MERTILMNAKRYNILTMAIFGSLMLLAMFPCMIIDPCFHFHKPLEGIAYILEDERYQNNGIVRNFEYDALITGTSMTENFKTSMLDEIFDVNSVKVPYSGGRYKEIDDNIKAALENNRNIKKVFRGLDSGFFCIDKDAEFSGIEEQGYQYPYYLLDDNIFNDVSYIFNKQMIHFSTRVLRNTWNGNKMTSFDEYMYWIPNYTFNKEAVLSTFERPVYNSWILEVSEEERETTLGNIKQNVVETASKYPDVTFYYFITPYSICEWDMRFQRNTIDYWVEMERIVIEEILECPNIKLFSFENHFELVCNLDNYKDPYHYGEEVNKIILQCMEKGEYQITKENYKEYLQEIQQFYSSYDYDSIYD